MKETFDFLKEKLKNESSVIVACSGGPDSMCLLSLVTKLKELQNIEVICIHINHKLRKESDDEKIFVENYCEKNNIIFEYLELNEFTKEKFSEQKAHKKRYNFYELIANKYKCRYVLTAHHGDDLIETILMRLTRGSTLGGYLGFKKESIKETYTILRPLITLTKEQILKYNQDNKLKYVIDKSNFSDLYTRNRYRKYILPFLKKEDKNNNLKYLKFNEELIEYDMFVNNYINNLNVLENNKININKIIKESDFIKRKVIELLIKNIQKDDLLEINEQNIKDILKLYEGNNRFINLNNNYIAIKDYEYILIKKKEEKKKFNLEFKKQLIINEYKFCLDDENKDNENIIRLNSNELKMPLYFRNRIDGDKIEIKNLGLKKVKDIFIDCKVSKLKRDKIPLLVDAENKVLWIPEIKKSKFAKNINEKCDIIIKCEREK